MGKNLKQQFLYAINSNFKQGMDKHSLKSQNIKNDGKIYSFADRKNLIDTACNFSNWMKENHPNTRYVKDVSSNHIQHFLNDKSRNCSKATLEQYGSKFRKLEKCVNKTYNTKADYKGFATPVSVENTKIRNTSMSAEDFNKLKDVLKNSKSCAATAISLTEKTGLRVSEITKLQGRDIDLKNNCIHVVDSKGKRSRDVPIEKDHKSYFEALRASVSDRERVCAVQPDSVNKSIDRAMKKAGIKDKYNKTSIHCIRKMYAQRQYDICRSSSMSVKESCSRVSNLLGHGKNRDELIKQYVQDLH